jgi:hypothetical protein
MKKMRCVGHVARMERRCITGFWWGILMERDDLGNPDIDGRIILKCIFKKRDVVMDWIDLADNRDVSRIL